MKKALLALLSMLVLLVASSCSTDESLVGTRWLYHTEGTDEVFELCFYSQQDVELSLTTDSTVETLYGTYEYNPPYIFFKFPKPESTNGDTLEASGKVVGNTIDWEGDMIFTRI
jgi:hypothetical protein